jgi:hypothetical protein
VRFGQFHHAGQTARDVVRLGPARDLRHHAAGVDLVAVAYPEVSMGRHEVFLAILRTNFGTDFDGHLPRFAR